MGILERGSDLQNLSRLCCLVTKSCPTLCGPMDCSPPDSSVHGISQARVLEWAAISFSKGSSRPRDQPASLASPLLADGFFTTWETLIIQREGFKGLWRLDVGVDVI